MSTVTVSERPETAKTGRGERLKRVLRDLLQQGLQPRQLALALAVGATIGVFPTVWGTGILCCITAYCFGLNQVIVQIANCLVLPLQILLFVPYFRFGETLFSTQALPANLDTLPALMQSAPMSIASQLWRTNLQAITIWLLTSPLLLATAFFISLPLVERLRPTRDCGDS